METVYDWITVLIFAALVTRFLQCSAGPQESDENIWHYIVPSLGCAAANWLGNGGWHWAAAMIIVASIAYSLIFIAKVGWRRG